MQKTTKTSVSNTINTTSTGPIHLPSDGRDVVVEVQHLVKTFGKHEAVKDVSFTIGKGEIFGLLGPNGAGKSTTINMMCGYLKPTAGDVSVNGLSLSRHVREVKRIIGVVPQEIALYKDLNSLENLEFFGKIYGLSKQECKQRAEKLLNFVGLYERRKDAVKTFSGGMQRRINMAIGLMNEPDFLMMDEPTVGVDPQSREHIFTTIEHIRDQGTTLLYTTHYMEEAERLCNRIAIMDEGKIIALGTLEQLLALRDRQQEVQRPHGLQELFIQLTGKTLRD
ncbi:ABC transporter ATP-binding protein [Dictyobacter formicarum]|uniref:ABC transporter ATP-binding protein YfiL n=1 Tax=Dictyobacter formicarum TaxID=2778368 RepID=A0ABQ3VDM0_9CHLR|nr:ATP-binding cassette domain-containing protein [Dictyobacter formicarum]GHO83591.1 putative ABC transporter ATP-binding protein YfiL [Dictyobacter formicarum]